MNRPVDCWVLDLARDPTPGSPAAVRRMARSWSGLADDAEYEATLPPGATVYQGPAGPPTGTTIPGHLDGGGEQVYVPRMPADWLTPGVRELQP